MAADAIAAQCSQSVGTRRNKPLVILQQVIVCPTRKPLAMHGVGMSSFKKRLEVMACSVSGY